MAAPLEVCSRFEQRAVIRFLRSDNLSGSEIHRMLVEKYGTMCLSKTQVYEWCMKFDNGETCLADAPRAGRSVTATPSVIEGINTFVRNNRRVTIDELCENFSLSHGTVHSIVTTNLKYRKNASRWVPMELTANQRKLRVEACKEFLRRYEEDSTFLSRIITGDETWIMYIQPETRKRTREWRHSTSPRVSTPKVARSTKKILLTFFWDEKGPILEHYMPPGSTVTSESYVDVLQNHLKPAIRSKRRGLLSKGVLLLHDNARPHTSSTTIDTIDNLGFEVLKHPPYSPDLAPSDYHIFGSLKDSLGGTTNSTAAQVEQAVHEWIASRPPIFFSTGINSLVQRWRLCIECQGHYFDK